MIKADNTQKRCFVACDEQTRKDGRCSCLTNTHQALQLLQPDVITSVCDNCKDVTGFYLGTTCPKCNRPFRVVKQTEL